jgi:UDP-N-acetylglucosamine 2-epimerase (non-hydrolysing)/GDP/UDP-N,N'-diacetylbacillosamine 2-epimerase (hydrolysing)
VRRIAVVTGSRADYGIYTPLLRRLRDEPAVTVVLLVTGAHLSAEFGMTVRAIEADGFEIAERIDMQVGPDTPEAISRSTALAVSGFAAAFARRRPDLLVVLGDRLEMLAAATASLPFKIPVAHIHGGEATEGAIDDAVRHALTKMSHLHFAALEIYADRIIQMGESPWRVTVSGAPGLDHLVDFTPLSRAELQRACGVRVADGTVIVTYHPVTLEYEQTAWQMAELLAALREVRTPVVFTFPGADTGSRTIIEAARRYVAEAPDAQLTVSLGTRGYLSLLSHAAAMVGNSSSGILEAASFRLPVVNIGTRQQGRVRGKNVLDVGYTRAEIAAAMRTAVSREFRTSLADLVNPYGDGRAAERIVDRLRSVELGDALLRKRFHDAR